MSLVLVNLILLLIILILLLMLSMVWPPDSPWAPWWRTNKNTAVAICKLAKITSKDIVYDLGCGDGTFILSASKKNAKVMGIEIDPLRFLIAKIRIYKNKASDKIILKRKNFFNEDLSSASVIVVYLVPKALERLLPKFKKELNKKVRIVSYRYKMNLTLVAYDKKNSLYLYRI